jgi:hypothetical protein
MTGKHTVIDMAKRRPKGDEIVRKVFEAWQHENVVSPDSKTPLLDSIEVGINHLQMEYKVGLISKDQVLVKLKDYGEYVTWTRSATEMQKQRLQNLLKSIEDDTFEVSVR